MRNGDVLPIEIMARKEDWTDGISIHMRQRTVAHGTMAAQKIEFAPQAPHVISEPCLVLDLDLAQTLMDELYRCGIRPTEGSGSAGSLAATQKHLEDMQKIAMGLLRKNKVEL